MYIEFLLSSGAGGMAAGYSSLSLHHNIETWAKKYNISYKTKIVKYTLRLSLESEKDYSFFQLSWNPDNQYWTQYTVIYPDGHGRS